MTRVRELAALAAALAILGAGEALAATKRYERGPEKISVGTQDGKQGYWIEYDENTYEKAEDQVRALAAGKLSDADVAALVRQIRQGGKTVSATEVKALVKKAVDAGGAKTAPASSGKAAQPQGAAPVPGR